MVANDLNINKIKGGIMTTKTISKELENRLTSKQKKEIEKALKITVKKYQDTIKKLAST